MIDKTSYLENLLGEYAGSFDLVRDYEIGGVKALAYGYFSTVSEKYVLTPKANLWSIHGFEHILFLDRSSVTPKDIDAIKTLMAEHMAPKLVCKGKRYPEKDHMYSYVTVALLCDTPPDTEAIKAIQHFRFEKDYLLTIRGHVEGHLVLMDLSTGKAYANKVAKHLIDFYEKERR